MTDDRLINWLLPDQQREVLDALAKVREDGQTNMFDQPAVVYYACEYSPDAAAALAMCDGKEYMTLLNEMGREVVQSRRTTEDSGG